MSTENERNNPMIRYEKTNYIKLIYCALIKFI